MDIDSEMCMDMEEVQNEEDQGDLIGMRMRMRMQITMRMTVNRMMIWTLTLTWTWKKYRMRMIKVIWLRHRNVWGRTFWRTRRNTVRLCIAINCV